MVVEAVQNQDTGVGAAVVVLEAEEQIHRSLASASYYQKQCALLFSAQCCHWWRVKKKYHFGSRDRLHLFPVNTSLHSIVPCQENHH